MGDLFEKLCKGPVVVVDDRIGDEEDLINKLIAEIEENNLPVLGYKSIDETRKILPGLLFSNFIILDWIMIGVKEDLTTGVRMGDEAETVAEKEVIELIKELLEICLAPIFILSALPKDGIVSKLKSAGIINEGNECVFVENKTVLCEKKGALISKIEDWIRESTHIYLAKCWTNELLSKNTMVFWDLYKSNPDWPTIFYRSFEKDGEDPILALRDTLIQVVLSNIDLSSTEVSPLIKEIEEPNIESLKDLYKKLVYIDTGIDKDIRPGDIFEKDGAYFLNIRPECDTTKRTTNPDLYLLEGEAKEPKILKGQYDGKFGFLDKITEITAFFLDDNPIVQFSNRKLRIKKPTEMGDYRKVCRVASPIIADWRQRYCSFLGRFGVPSYPNQIFDSLFETEQTIEPEKGEL